MERNIQKNFFTNVYINLFLLLEFIFCENWFVKETFVFEGQALGTGPYEYFYRFLPKQLIPLMLLILLSFVFCYCLKKIIRYFSMVLLFLLNIYVTSGGLYYIDLSILINILICGLILILSYQAIKKNQKSNCVNIIFITMLIYFYGTVTIVLSSYPELLFSGKRIFRLIFSIMILIGLFVDLFLNRSVINRIILKISIISIILIDWIITDGRRFFNIQKDFFNYFNSFFIHKKNSSEMGDYHTLVFFLFYIGFAYYIISVFLEKKKNLNIDQ